MYGAERTWGFSMKIILAILLSALGTAAYAIPPQQPSQSLQDMRAILNSEVIKNVVAETEVKSVTNLGKRRYTILFGSCAANVNVVSTCAPIPGGPCVDEVKLDPSQVNCLP